MEKTYQPQVIEQPCYQEWEQRDYFAPRGGDKPYCIMIPPPNVTGTLHMGHAFQDTLMDTLIRYHRMKGNNTLWQPGCDHAGIATQMVVERQLNAEGKTRHDLGRKAFIERIWNWKEQSGGKITQQLRRMGASPDWSRERFTMDDGLSAAVQKMFIDLYDRGIIYRGKRLVNWDPVLHTALSDIEVISEEESGQLWHIRYPLNDASGHLVVATTRPETMLGDTAVAVNPNDRRYQRLIGKTIELPLVGREIRVVADDYVDANFGSGCVKITPAHDHNDYALGQRHQLPIINIFTDDAAINDNAPPAYRGLDRYAARKQVIADLEAAGLIEKIVPHKLMVPRGDRSNSVIEPYLTDQWYVDMTCETQTDGRPGGKTLITQPSIDCVRDGRIEFVPDNWSKTYYGWMENIQDWCISRQIWWGHRIPAWYDSDGNIYVAENEPAVRDKYKLDDTVALKQDDDVLDTWFSSALWPFSTLGWPDQTDYLKTFYPTSVLVTGFDIIFFWVARMIMFGLVAMDGKVPFHKIYIHGLVRDANGAKMSKSKGNVLDPLDIIDGIDIDELIEKRTGNMMQPHLAEKIAQQTLKEFPNGIPSYGTDALRFTFASLASTGRDIRFDLKRVEGYRNFCNKLWNASRYVLIHVEGKLPTDEQQGYQPHTLVDCWIVSRLQHVIGEIREHLDTYRFDLAANAIYEFAWNEYCDWYVELSKPMLTSDADKAATRRTLVHVLDNILRLTHPIMPYITDSLWKKIGPLAGAKQDSIMIAPFPAPDPSQQNQEAESTIEWIKAFVLGVRKIRAEINISPGKPLPLLLNNSSAEDQQRISQHGTLLESLARLASIKLLNNNDNVPESAMALVGDLQLLIPLSGLIDKNSEITRLKKEIGKLQGEIKRLSSKLNNQQFTAKAPSAIVTKEKLRLAEAEQAHQQLSEQLNKYAFAK